MEIRGGWGEGHALLPHFDVLGMHINLEPMWAGEISISNKVDLGKFATIKIQGKLSRHERQVLVGLLRLAAGFFGGRQLRYVCNDLNTLIFEGGNPSPGAARVLCDRAVQAMENATPLELRAANSRTPVRVFTDGSFENSVAGVGAVVCDAESGLGKVFGGTLPKSLARKLLPLVRNKLSARLN